MNKKRKNIKNIKFWLVCLKYQPGNWQHIESFTTQASNNGYSVHLILSKYFNWMVNKFQYCTTFITLSSGFFTILFDIFYFLAYRWFVIWRLMRKEKPETIIFVMWHPLNPLFCLMGKLAADSRCIIWLHEPYKKDKWVYGLKGAIIFLTVEFIQTLTMFWLDDIILHSDIALQAFRKRYPNIKQTVHLIPLQFHDKSKINCDRMLISFLGRATKAKGIDKFLKLIEVSTLKNLEWEFGIATSSNISDHLKMISQKARDKLEIVSSPYLSDEALINMASRSLAVICLYSSNLQSGVVPIAFMCGVPVIATDIKGLQPYIDHGKTGYFVSISAKPEIILAKIESIHKNFPVLSQNCRHKFLSTFDDRKWKDSYGWLCNNQYKSK